MTKKNIVKILLKNANVKRTGGGFKGGRKSSPLFGGVYMLQVKEVFTSIQGEGVQMGREAVFVRFTGCNLRCSWCDTRYAWNDGDFMSAAALATKVLEYPQKLVVITGGEPLLQGAKELEMFCLFLTLGKKELAIETNGTIIPSKELCKLINFWSVSPKLLNSPLTSQEGSVLCSWLNLPIRQLQFKIIITKARDFLALNEMLKYVDPTIMEKTIFVIQPESSVAKNLYELLPSLCALFVPKLKHAKFLPQLHKLMDIK